MKEEAWIIRERLIDIFEHNILGKKADLSLYNANHDGKAGNWLEQQFGKSPDSDNSADFWGFELKNETTSKTTFGDWSPNYSVYKDKIGNNDVFSYRRIRDNQDLFCHFFGRPNEKKHNRYSWSGEPVPKIGSYNSYGQTILVSDESDIYVLYSFDFDQRINKSEIVPSHYQHNDVILAIWFGYRFPQNYSPKKNEKCLKDKFEDKFNQNGWFTCKTDENGYYNKICFGDPLSFEEWIEYVKKGIVYLDSGMYEGNGRPYQSWRADNSFWDKLIQLEYDKDRIERRRYCIEHHLGAIAIDEYERIRKEEKS